MISRLNAFQGLHPKEKILWASATLTDFDKIYQTALASKIKLQEYFDRVAHGHAQGTHGVGAKGLGLDKSGNPPEVTPEQDAISNVNGLEAIVLKPSTHLQP